MIALIAVGWGLGLAIAWALRRKIRAVERRGDENLELMAGLSKTTADCFGALGDRVLKLEAKKPKRIRKARK